MIANELEGKKNTQESTNEITKCCAYGSTASWIKKFVKQNTLTNHHED